MALKVIYKGHLCLHLIPHYTRFARIHSVSDLGNSLKKASWVESNAHDCTCIREGA